MARRYWTAEEELQLREWFGRTDLFVSDMAARLGRPITLVYQKAHKLGLRRPEEIRSIAGRLGSLCEEAKATRFIKGNIPVNKGKKMSPETYAKVSRTMFRKGHRSTNKRSVGSERVNVGGYVEVKVAEPNKWRVKHRIIWEEAHGPIEKGYNVQFKDGNPRNISLENLYLISRAQQMKEQNSLMARYPKEIRDVIHLRGAIKRQMTLNNKRKENKDEQQ